MWPDCNRRCSLTDGVFSALPCSISIAWSRSRLCRAATLAYHKAVQVPVSALVLISRRVNAVSRHHVQRQHLWTVGYFGGFPPIPPKASFVLGTCSSDRGDSAKCQAKLTLNFLHDLFGSSYARQRWLDSLRVLLTGSSSFLDIREALQAQKCRIFR